MDTKSGTAIERMSKFFEDNGIDYRAGRRMILWDYDKEKHEFRYCADSTGKGNVKVTMWDVTPEEAINATTKDVDVTAIRWYVEDLKSKNEELRKYAKQLYTCLTVQERNHGLRYPCRGCRFNSDSFSCNFTEKLIELDLVDF